MPGVSIEQHVRDLLELAVRDGLVEWAVGNWDDADPQARSSGELVAVANKLAEILRAEATIPAAERDRYKEALETIRRQCEALHPSFQDRLHAVWRIAGEALREGD